MTSTQMMKDESSTTTENWMGISYFAVTGEGGRPYNEDFYGHAAYADTLTFVVSDGIGGHAGGAAAARLVVEMVRTKAHSLDRDEMLRCYEGIEQEICHRQQQDPHCQKMGATIAELRIDPARQMARWGHFGDSRVYWFRDHEIMAVTHDHSVVRSLVAAGLISEQEALTHSKKNILLGAFGVTSDISPEVLEKPVYIADGDAFLLCTDGLWNYLSDDEIKEELNKSSSVEDWVKALEVKIGQVVFDNKDNYTIIGIWITPSSNRTVHMTR
jgi:serine/threonine protein phosphatase PrpC